MKSIQSGYVENGVHFFPLRVYFSETDAGGVVYHSRYLDMAEHARTEFLHLVGINHQEYLKKCNTSFVVRSVKAEYIRPALLDQTLIVRTRGKKLGRFAMELVQDVMHQGEVIASLDIRLGYISLTDGRPSPLPDAWKPLLETVVAPPSV